jgi:hypothetical protein
MTAFRRNLFRLLAAALLSFASAALLAAQTPAEVGAELARRIVARAGPGRDVALKLRNLSSLKAADVSLLLGALENELQSHAVRVTAEATAATEIVVTVSENLRGPLAVAQIRREGSEEVVIVPFSRPAEPETPSVVETVRLERELLLEHDAPILDAALVAAGTPAARQWLLVLRPDAVLLLEKTDAGWAERRRTAVEAAQPMPRDARGRLLLEGEAFWAYLPGMVCGGAVMDARVPRLTLECAALDEPWPIHAGGEVRGYAYFSRGRNFFDGRVEAAGGAIHSWPPFFSAAPLEMAGRRGFVLAGPDGRARLFTERTELDAAFSGSGSDIAVVKTSCGSGAQVLATGTGDWEAADSVRALEISEREAAVVSMLVSFPGPVTALWPASDTSALAVARNRKTGRYEAYILTAACIR